MKNMRFKSIILSLLAICSFSCEDEFLNNPSQTQPTIDTYYVNAEQVNGATGILYNNAWNDWSDKAFTAVGDILGGTVTGVAGNSQYNSFYNFNIQATDGLINSTWRACYKAAGNASVLIATFEDKKSTVSGNTAYLDLGIAEAKFIRAFAYFYIARTFKDAPIVPNPLDLTKPGQNLVPRYFQKDILRFALEDLMVAEKGLPQKSYQIGRVTSASAKGMMAKIYLYDKQYDKAAEKAKEVMDYADANSGIVGLVNDYQEMFTTSRSNNNKESLFALQWKTSMSWNGANRFMTYAGAAPLLRPSPTSTTAAYSSVVPSIDMLNSKTGYYPGDERRNGSVMTHGFYKEDWKNENFPNGFKYDTTGRTDNFKIRTSTRSNILKYIVGPNSTSEPVNTNAHSSMNTYILRYADVLLIYAEAKMNGSGATSDASALAAFNKVHNRAGLQSVTSLNLDMLLHERKVEFAFEGDYWFDISRQGFVKAAAIVAAQERGGYGDDGQLNSFKANLTSESQLFLPVPQAETISNPLLLEPAVNFYE
jgi:hypothetical protein